MKKKYIGSRSIDPLGRVFTFENNESSYFREIPREILDFATELTLLPSFKECIDKGLFPETKIISDKDDVSLLVSEACPHQILPKGKEGTMIGPENLPFATRVLAARNWISINQILLNDNLALIDGHWGNFVLSEIGEPVWVDLGSIRNLNSFLDGFEEFLNQHYLIIVGLLKKRNCAHIFRKASFPPGISLSAAKELGLGADTLSFRLLRKFLLLSTKFKLLTANKARRYLIRYFEIKLNKISLSAAPTDYWSDYGGSRLKEVKRNNRDTLIAETINSLEYKSLLDVGANDGGVITQIFKRNKHYTAIDPDDYSISKLVSYCHNLPPDSKPNLISFIGDFESTNIRAELVLALALTHHLSLSQDYSFDFIAKKLRSLTSKYVITEFMPFGLGRDNFESTLPAWYNQDHFKDALLKNFKKVEVIDYDPGLGESKRILYVASIK